MSGPVRIPAAMNTVDIPATDPANEPAQYRGRRISVAPMMDWTE
jgi:hypothetical protein